MELKTYFAQDAAGNIISSAIVNVFLQGTTTLATGLTRADGTPLENPFAADGAGRIQFRAPDGYYDVQVSAGPGIIQTLTIQCVDYSGAKADADSAKAAADRAETNAEAAEQALADFQVQAAGLLPKADLAANDGEKLIGVCPTIATLRTIEPVTDGQRITLREYAAGTGKGGGQFRAVLDGSTYTDDNGTIIKTAGGAVWLRINAEILSPLMFGCVANAKGTGDATGVTDDTVPMRNAIIAAAALKRPLRGAGEIYGITSMLTMFAGNTEISYLNIDIIRATSSGELSELFSYKATGSSRITLDFHHNYIFTNKKVRQPIILDGTRRCKIRDNTILDVDTAECYGIRIGISGSGFDNLFNDIYNNYITVGDDPDGGVGTVTRNGIVLFGNYADPVVGQSGGPDWAAYPPSVQNSRIFNNTISGGTHNIHIRGCNVVDIFGNTLLGGSHRNINLSRMCQRVHIHDNMLLSAGSAAVVFGYCRWIKITSNYIYSSVVTEQGGDDSAIQFGEWVEGLEIHNNTIKGDWVWGVHGETLRGSSILGNDIQASRAGIALESQWTSTVPAGATYTVSRNVPFKANTNTFDVLISGNKLDVPSGGCGIYLSAFNGRQMQRIDIDGNFHGGASLSHCVFGYEDTAGLMGNIRLSNHHAPGAQLTNYSFNSAIALSSVHNVTGLTTVVQTINAAGDATAYGTKSFSFGAAVAATNILGPYNDGETITIRGMTGASLVHNSARIRLRGSANASFADENGVVTLMKQAGVWFETARNF